MTVGGLRRDPRSARRKMVGFSLVELLVVIVIIGVLIGLLIPVLGIARASVQQSAITTEVATLSQALESFNTQYNAGYPPDFTGPIAVGQRTLVQADPAVINQYLGRLFRYRNAQTDVPRRPDGSVDPQGLQKMALLDPSEALVFWLRGFTDDPANPLFGPVGTRPDAVQRNPIFEFDETRLLDKDGDGFPEYYPRYAQDLPYVYLAHYNYLAAFQVPNFACRSGANQSAVIPCPRPYLTQHTGGAPPNPMLVNDYAGATKFQIIAAGLDNSFGTQLNSSNYQGFTFPQGPYPDKPHLDNITNFSEGTLEDRLP